jgi:hypothetical protein
MEKWTRGLSERSRKTLVAWALLLVILSAGFTLLLSIREGGLVSGTKLYRYSEAPIVQPSKSDVEEILILLGQSMGPSQTTALHEKLAGLVETGSGNDIIGEYTRNLYDLSGNLTLIESQLIGARSFLTSGNRSEAVALVNQLESHRSQTGLLLQSTHSLLNQIGKQYQLDTKTQTGELNALDQSYNGYSTQIDQLVSELQTTTNLVQTILNLNSSARQVFVGENVLIYGSLEDVNGSALAHKNLTISWSGRNILLESDPEGKFEENVSIPVGFATGFTIVDCAFQPSGQDKLLYQPSMAQVQIQVSYRPSMIDAKINPATARPLDTVTILGNLTTMNLKPLENRTIVITLDGAILGNVTTDRSGLFNYQFTVPETESNGTHVVEAIFNAIDQPYAPSNATLPFNVQILETQTQVAVDRNTVLSGMSFVINGTVRYLNATYNNQTIPISGNVTVFVDGVPYTNATINNQGSFVSSIHLPLGISFASHMISVRYAPDEPWVHSSESIVRIYVLSTPVITLAAAVIAVESYLGTFIIRQRRRQVLQRQAMLAMPPAQAVPILSEELSQTNLIRAVEAETDDLSRIRRAFALAQLIIEKRMGVEHRDTETPYEYFTRIVEAAPVLKDSMSYLVELFERAEYSPYPIVGEHVTLAKKKLLELREKLENVKPGEEYQH